MLTIEAEQDADLNDAIAEAVEAVELDTLKHYAAGVRREAIDSMHFAAGPAPRGEPPHAHRGRLRKSIVYQVDAGDMSAKIGQSDIKEAIIAARLEQTHPFMQPALVAANERFTKGA